MTDTRQVFYTAAPGQFPRVIDVAVLTEDGRTVGQCSGETAEQLGTRYGQPMELIGLDAYMAIHDEAMRTEPVEITHEDYMHALECLPPVRWQQSEGIESFRMSERWSGSMTSIYACLRGRYWRFIDDISMPVAELNQKIAAAARAVGA